MKPFNSSQISPKQIKGFVAIARSLSFAQAGEELHLSQPALSIAIKNLEQALGGKLFERSTRSLSLTPEGRDFLPVAKRLLADWDGALTDVHNQFQLKQGRLQLAVMPSFAATQLAKVLMPFNLAHPDINVTVHDVVAEDVVSYVREGKVELGIAFDPGPQEDLVFKPLFKDRFIAIVPPNHDLTKYAELTWSRLKQYSYVSLQAPSSMRDLIETKIGDSLPVSIESHQLVTIGQMVSAGLGVSIVPSLCQELMAQQGAICLPFKQPVITQSVGAIVRKRGALSAPAKGFLDTILL